MTRKNSIEKIVEQISGESCKRSDDPDKVAVCGSTEKIDLSADDISNAGISIENLPDEKGKVVDEEKRFVLFSVNCTCLF